ncbi:flavin reductase (DIM6/NTAB) family NADH-FMN oxidoreductase RutF [Streptomyces sp. Amel2xB2]|uniref:flavin reductase family protein n=1 Tax=Streptomyces sp. Amel2xB2 TaxID=1305829 RepID=UPI000DB99B49|nr:flavin reductase family protein [Streptomyces sp. Amel2xB2]RAJ58358.1 flavin reductase (DIM6/NTAB) family NADH-FMN oxidoreductase RutF [Streptomyces sp. Amel2xB2]
MTLAADAEHRAGAHAGNAPPTPDRILRRTLRQHAAGVTVITVPGPAGFTATSFTSVSLDPALVSFCLGTTASTAEAVRRADRFAVHVLGAENTALARQFARSGIDRFDGVPWTAAEDGLPLLDGVPAWLTARPTLLRQIGDHLLVVGEVDDGGASGGDAPGSALVHHDGGFVTTRQLDRPGR